MTIPYYFNNDRYEYNVWLSTATGSTLNFDFSIKEKEWHNKLVITNIRLNNT